MIDTLSQRMLQEFMYMMTGEVLGQGMSRRVYAHPHDPTKVIKMENKAGSFGNIQEWHIWDEFKAVASVAKWLAPCHHISDCGAFLIMERTQPLTIKKIPEKIPKFLTDHKRENFGMIDNRIVCHDYGFIIKTLDDKLVKWKGDKC